MSESFRSVLARAASNPHRFRYAHGRSASFEHDHEKRKRITEKGVVADFLEASGLAKETTPNSVSTVLIDPPDVSLRLICGATVGVEVTELVDQNWRQAAQAHGKISDEPFYNFKTYNEDEYLAALNVCIDRKCSKIWHGKYDKKWLLIHTGEPNLQYRFDDLSRTLCRSETMFDKIFILGATIPCAEARTVTEVAWGEILVGGAP